MGVECLELTEAAASFPNRPLATSFVPSLEEGIAYARRGIGLQRYWELGPRIRPSRAEGRPVCACGFLRAPVLAAAARRRKRRCLAPHEISRRSNGQTGRVLGRHRQIPGRRASDPQDNVDKGLDVEDVHLAVPIEVRPRDDIA